MISLTVFRLVYRAGTDEEQEIHICANSVVEATDALQRKEPQAVVLTWNTGRTGPEFFSREKSQEILEKSL